MFFFLFSFPFPFPPTPLLREAFQPRFGACTLQSSTCVLLAPFRRLGGLTLPRRRARLINAPEAKIHFFGARFRRGPGGRHPHAHTATCRHRPGTSRSSRRAGSKPTNKTIKPENEVALVALKGGELLSEKRQLSLHSWPGVAFCWTVLITCWLHPVETAQRLYPALMSSDRSHWV